jgi:hypothetical protein
MRPLRPLFLPLVVPFLVLSPGRAAADEPVVKATPLTSLRQLRRLSARELEALFAQADAAPPLLGYVRGQVLYLEGSAFPRAGAKLYGTVWKGKHFDEEGRFINQWAGFRALQSQAAWGPSWFDGGPCQILEYPPGTPVLGNMRDEVRQIAPGLYLARAYLLSPQPRFHGYIGLQLEPDARRPWR